MLRFKIEDQTVTAMLDDAPIRINKAAVRALNRAIGSGRTLMVKNIAADTNLKSATVREAITIRNATLSQPSATMASTLKRIPLIDFNAKGPEPSRGKGKGVTYKLGSGKELAPNAFIATMASGHRGVFARRSGQRLPIVELFGPSLGHVFIKYQALGIARAQDAFVTNFAHELDFYAQHSDGPGDAPAEDAA